MKKVLFVAAVAISLTACNSASTEATSTDSTTVVVDTTAVLDSASTADTTIVDTLN